mmetsp:Transcript_16492/g.35657  ORF Transcript_16492/g.35657 Transcript_16492/m.35657 type:complete len:207 (+) Transcript_16492:726-1346(+)
MVGRKSSAEAARALCRTGRSSKLASSAAMAFEAVCSMANLGVASSGSGDDKSMEELSLSLPELSSSCIISCKKFMFGFSLRIAVTAATRCSTCSSSLSSLSTSSWCQPLPAGFSTPPSAYVSAKVLGAGAATATSTGAVLDVEGSEGLISADCALFGPAVFVMSPKALRPTVGPGTCFPPCLSALPSPSDLTVFVMFPSAFLVESG